MSKLTYHLYNVQVIDNTLNPVWKPFDVAVQKLCNGDLDRSVKVIIIYIIFFAICSVFNLCMLSFGLGGSRRIVEREILPSVVALLTRIKAILETIVSFVQT